MERPQPVLDSPQGLGAVNARKHIPRTACGDSVLQQRIHAHHLGGGLHIEVVHRNRGNYALGIPGDSLAGLVEHYENLHTVIIEARARLQRRGIAPCRLQVVVVLLLPVVHQGVFGSDGVLQRRSFGLPLDFTVDPAANGCITFGKSRPFQRIGGHNLSLCHICSKAQKRYYDAV